VNLPSAVGPEAQLTNEELDDNNINEENPWYGW
jgi:hypothetical protein